ncbi:TraR/DksA C4-type zinc finger protein [Zavarzinia aquatilis]|uniref:TraR/DksA C4-type zinc finger protein n=1 Tax=Zavarzinia aquatilis TaxID=2211142 RepID=UPI001A9CABE3
MADDADRAAALVAAEREAAVDRHQRRDRPPVSIWCIECGDPIEEARREALKDEGVLRCVECQRIAERRL